MGSPFAGIEGARPTQGGVYPLPGAYRVKIDACKAGQTRKKIDFFVVEMTVLESDNPKRPPKTKMSWMVTMDKEPALGNIKSFVAVATGVEDSEVDEPGVLAIVSKDNPLLGTIVRMIATEVETKAGKPFTRVVWQPDGAEAAA